MERSSNLRKNIHKVTNIHILNYILKIKPKSDIPIFFLDSSDSSIRLWNPSQNSKKDIDWKFIVFSWRLNYLSENKCISLESAFFWVKSSSFLVENWSFLVQNSDTLMKINFSVENLYFPVHIQLFGRSFPFLYWKFKNFGWNWFSSWLINLSWLEMQFLIIIIF